MIVAIYRKLAIVLVVRGTLYRRLSLTWMDYCNCNCAVWGGLCAAGTEHIDVHP